MLGSALQQRVQQRLLFGLADEVDHSLLDALGGGRLTGATETCDRVVED